MPPRKVAVKPKPKPKSRGVNKQPKNAPQKHWHDDDDDSCSDLDDSSEIFTRSSDSETDSEIQDFVVCDEEASDSDDDYDPDAAEQEMIAEASRYIVHGRRQRKPVQRYVDPRLTKLMTHDVDLDEYFDTEETDDARARAARACHDDDDANDDQDSEYACTDDDDDDSDYSE